MDDTNLKVEFNLISGCHLFWSSTLDGALNQWSYRCSALCGTEFWRACLIYKTL